ncbi:MAG: type II toxin-antitoxin system VapC family toxin, partial [Planctomycetota bacterium]
ARVRERFESIAEENLFLSVLTIGELKKGIDKLKASGKKRSLSAWFDQLVESAQDRILTIDCETSLLWGEIAAKSEKGGKPIPAVDGLIAATAIRHGMRLMTRNVADFQFTGAMIVNPWEVA